MSPLLQYQALAEPLQVDAAAVPDLSGWLAQPPDPVPVRRIATALLATTLAFVPAPAPTEIGPDAQFPDQIPRARIHAREIPAWFGPVNPSGDGDLRWEPQHPDQVWRHTLATALHQTSAQNISPLPNEDAPALSWQGEAPDAITRGRVLPPHQQALALWPLALPAADQSPAGECGVIEPPRLFQYQALAGPVLVPAPAVVPDLSWGPQYPDAYRTRVVPAALQLPSVTPLYPMLPVPELSWAPVAPAWHATRALPTAAQQALTARPLEPPTTLALNDLRWAPTFPERVDARPYPIGARTSVTGAFAPVFPLPAPTVWQPEFPDPDFVVRYHTRTDAQQVLALNVDPIATVTLDDLRWGPSYPARVIRPRLLTALIPTHAGPVDPLPVSALVALSWDGNYPDLLRPHPSTAGLVAGPVAPPELIEVVVQQAPWRPTYPDQHLRLRVPPIGPQPELRLDAATLADDHTCIELDGLTATQPALALTVRQSTIRDLDGVAVPSGLEVC